MCEGGSLSVARPCSWPPAPPREAFDVLRRGTASRFLKSLVEFSTEEALFKFHMIRPCPSFILNFLKLGRDWDASLIILE